MPRPFIGHVMPVAFDYAPRGWLLCHGQVLNIHDHPALFSLISNTYGGDGLTTFGLPDLRGRIVIGSGQGPELTQRPLGTRVGSESVTLTPAQLPPHIHEFRASGAASDGDPNRGDILAATPEGFAPAYAPGTSMVVPAQVSTGLNVGGAAHENRQPYVVINHIICVSGFYPTRR